MRASRSAWVESTSTTPETRSGCVRASAAPPDGRTTHPPVQPVRSAPNREVRLADRRPHSWRRRCRRLDHLGQARPLEQAYPWIVPLSEQPLHRRPHETTCCQVRRSEWSWSGPFPDRGSSCGGRAQRRHTHYRSRKALEPSTQSRYHRPQIRNLDTSAASRSRPVAVRCKRVERMGRLAYPASFAQVDHCAGRSRNVDFVQWGRGGSQ